MYRRLNALGFLSWLSYYIARFPVIPLYAASLGMGKEAIGWIGAASTLTGIPGKSLFGGLSDTWGRRRLIVLGTFVLTAVPFLYFISEGPVTLFGVRMVHGVATASLGPVMRAYMSDITPAGERGLRLGIFSSSTHLGRSLGPWICGYMMAIGGFRFPFLGAAGIGAVALFLALGLGRVPGGGAGTENAPGSDWAEALRELGRGLREVMRSRFILGTSLVEMGQFFATGTVEVFLPIYCHEIGFSPARIGWLFLFQVAATLLAKPIMGRISDRIGRVPQIIGGLVFGALTVWIFPRLESFPALLAVAALYGGAVATVTSASAAMITDLAARERYGSAHGVFGTLMDVGHASGPIVAGIIIARAGYRQAFLTCSGVLLAAGVLFLLMVVPRRTIPGAAGGGGAF